MDKTFTNRWVLYSNIWTWKLFQIFYQKLWVTINILHLCAIHFKNCLIKNISYIFQYNILLFFPFFFRTAISSFLLFLYTMNILHLCAIPFKNCIIKTIFHIFQYHIFLLFPMFCQDCKRFIFVLFVFLCLHNFIKFLVTIPSIQGFVNTWHPIVIPYKQLIVANFFLSKLNVAL